MEYIGKKLIRYGDCEFLADEYKIPVSDELWQKILSVATIEQLDGILQEQIECENYEAAKEVKDIIAERLPQTKNPGFPLSVVSPA